MFAKVVLISAILSFVYVQSIESCESETPHDILRLDADMNTRSTKTIERKLVSKADAEAETEAEAVPENQRAVRTLVPAEKGSTEKPPMSHELVHPGMKHPKKRTTNYKEDRKVDLRPGCCG
ncbi:uncharacterized protein LOC143355184 [Halictus rubicundus]|uniref:uncharacterized protein LOC143355184 n=1 Tax=Halictus rubicundus TaxID=77578 RepID=UPI004035E9AC